MCFTALSASSEFENSTAAFPLFNPANSSAPNYAHQLVDSDAQTLNKGRSNPVTLPYSPKISSKCSRWTFLLNPETTITLNPPDGLDPFIRGRGDLVLDLDLETERGRGGGDIDTSDPRLRRAGGGDGESDLGVRDLPLPLSDMIVLDVYDGADTEVRAQECIQRTIGKTSVKCTLWHLILLSGEILHINAKTTRKTQEHFAIHIHIEPTQNIVYEHPIIDIDI
jgi:hypothetical protein